ncbi:MAG: DUF1573 domain-containing protein [Prevotella sp.]|jgi:hypothetical protein|nr:DUF1573 domain-containing protein [Prevotella sp.]
MYRLLILVFSIILISSCTSKEKPELRLSADIYDFGNIHKDSIYQGSTIIKNTGGTPLVIRSIEPDCGCTDVSLSKMTILPNDTSLMNFSFKTFNKYGKQENYICIIANTDSLIHLLQINAYIEE